MSGESTFRAAVIVALLLPGLVLAGSVPGPCDRCDDGESCHLQQSPRPESDSHICCGSAADESPSEIALNSSGCECGREVPPAMISESFSTVELGVVPVSALAAFGPGSPGDSPRVRSVRPPAPPPAPPAYLVDCAFLT